MTDEGTPLDEPFPADIDEAREHVDGLVTQRACPFCGETRWGHSEDRVVVLKEYYRGTDARGVMAWMEVPDDTIPAIWFQRERCGFLRFHAPPRFPVL